MSRIFHLLSGLLLAWAALFTGCASHQGPGHRSLVDVAQETVSRLPAGGRVIFLGLSGADGQKDRLAARVYRYLDQVIQKKVRKQRATMVDLNGLDLLRDMWRLDLAGVGRSDAGAAFLTGADTVIRGTVVAEGEEVRVFLRADDIKEGRELMADREGWIALKKLPRTAPIQVTYDASPYRSKSPDGRLELWSASPAYERGSDMHFFFRVKKKGYVTIFEVNSDGKRRVIYPNTFQPRLLCRPGAAYQVPSAEAPLALPAEGRPGNARYVAVLTGRPGIEEIGMQDIGPAFTDTMVQGAMARAAIRVRME